MSKVLSFLERWLLIIDDDEDAFLSLSFSLFFPLFFSSSLTPSPYRIFYCINRWELEPFSTSRYFFHPRPSDTSWHKLTFCVWRKEKRKNGIYVLSKTLCVKRVSDLPRYAGPKCFLPFFSFFFPFSFLSHSSFLFSFKPSSSPLTSSTETHNE